jgi:excisionase family DNA binding protein
MNEHQQKFTVKELAERLRLSIDCVRNLIRSGEIRAIDVSLKPGQGKPRYRVDLADVLSFEARREVATAPKRRPRRRKDPHLIEFIR